MLRTRPLFLILTLCVSASAQIANITVTSAADFSVGLPAPGGAATLFCTGLDVSGVVAAKGYPLPFTLAGVRVTVGGLPAPLYAVASLGSSQQVNFEVPAQFSFSNANGPVVTVTQGSQSGTGTASQNMEIAQFFTLPLALAGAAGIGIFQHLPDYSFVTQENPARSGETLVGYLTGLPFLTPLPPDGQPASATTLSVSAPLPTITFFSSQGQASAAALFAGLSPGSVGLGQVNFTVPQLAAATYVVKAGLCFPNVAFGPGCATFYSNEVLLPIGQ